MAVVGSKAQGRQVKKSGKAREYTTIYFGDQVSAKGIVSPIFVKVLKSAIALIGGGQKFSVVPSKEYTTPAGIKVKYYRDTNGLVWRNRKGTAKGVNYAYTDIVDPPVQKNEVILRLVSKGGAVASSLAGAKEKFQLVKIGVPVGVNAQQVGEWVKSNITSAKVQSWKYGDTVETLIPLERRGGGGGGRKPKIAATPWFIPIGTTVASGLTKAGNAAKKGQSETITYAVLYDDSALLLGFKKSEESSEQDIAKGTKIAAGAAQDSKKALNFNVFSTLKLYSQVWTNTGDQNHDTKTPISNYGTGVKVKCRFTKRANVALATHVQTHATSRVKVASQHTYAYFSVPSGTPKGMIAEALMLMPARPRSFQISNGGSHYGTTTYLPSKNKGNIAEKDPRAGY